jgi:hypothetical protein
MIARSLPLAASPPSRSAADRLRATARRWAGDAAFQFLGLLTSIVGFAIWVTGATATISLLIVWVGVVIGIGSLIAFRWFADVERWRAGLVLGRPIARPARRWEGPGLRDRARAVPKDPSTWRDFAWTGLAGFVAFPLGTAAVTAWATVLGLIAMPAWYWSLPDGAQLGIYEADTLPRALLTSAIGLVLIPVCGYLVRGMTMLELAIMKPLLRARGVVESLI